MLYSRQNGLANARLGVVAAKRLAPRAVTRNAIKRAAREAFRQTALPNVDCIVRLAKPVNVRSGPAMTTAVKRLLRSEMAQLFRAPFPIGPLPVVQDALIAGPKTDTAMSHSGDDAAFAPRTESRAE